jgi:hypothetical protein
MPVGRGFEIVVLNEDDYQNERQKAFEKVSFSDAFTKEMLSSEFEQFDTKLRQALSRQWKEDPFMEGDFAIMDTEEWSGTWHHCGAIYSGRVCCPEYVETILNAIRSLPHAALWTYHTACECVDDGAEFVGEFFVRAGKLYVPEDGNDYAKVFGRNS